MTTLVLAIITAVVLLGDIRLKIFTDIARVYNYVPHYGSYSPSRIRFIIRNYEFYPYKLKLNDVNDACPKECVSTEHIPEWQLLESSFSCAGSPATINEMIYGAEGGVVQDFNNDGVINNSADVFACCTKLISDRQLMSCMGKYSTNTSYAMRVANYVASSPSVWDYGGQGKCSYPKCELHREEDQLAIGVSDGLGRTPCSRTIDSIDLDTSEAVGISDVCIDSQLQGGGNCKPAVVFEFRYGLWTNAAGFSFTTPYTQDPSSVFFVGMDMKPRSVKVVGSNGYLSVSPIYSETEYLVNSHAPFSERRMANQNRDIYATYAKDATEYSTEQLEYAKTCTSQSLDVEGFEIENEFAEEHNICVNEVSFGETFSLDKEIQRGKSNSFNARQQSDVVIKDPSCGEGLRWRVDTDNVGVYETLFDYDSDEDVSHACYFYEKGQLDLIYQQYVPAIEFAKGREAGRKMRSIADCVAGYLTTFNYWYQIAGTSPEDDIIIALRPEDDGYFETEIRSDQSPVTILEIKKLEGDLVEGGEEIFVVQTGEFEIRNQFFTGEVIELKVNIGDDVQEGQVIMLTKFGDTIREVLSTKDGEITEIKEIGPIERRDVLAKVITKNSILCPPFIEGAIRTIDVEVDEIVSSTRKVMATISNTITYPAGSYVKVKPNGEFEAPFDNHSMYQNENHYEVKDEVKIEIDGVWAKGRPAEGKRNILPDNAGIPNEIKHEGEDGYKFTFYTTGIPSAHAYDYGVKDDQAPELGDSLSEFFSDRFVDVFDEISNTIVEKRPASDGECTSGFQGDDANEYDDDVYHVIYNNPDITWCNHGGYVFASPFGGLPPCGYNTEQRITGDKNFYKTSSGTLVESTTSVDVPAVQSDIPEHDGLLGAGPVMLACYSAPLAVRNTGTKRSGCRNAEGTLNFCDPCFKDVECSYQGNVCPSNYDYKVIRVPEKSYIAYGAGLWMPINGSSQAVEFKTSSRTGGDPWDYVYTIGDSADGSYGQTETYRCIESFVTLNTDDSGYLSGCLGGVTYSRSIFPTDAYEIDNSCLVPTDDETPCPDEEKNYNIGSTITATYRKIVLKSKFNKCGDDRLPNLNYSHKDLVDTSSGDKKIFPQAVIAKSVELSEHDLSLDDFDITEEQKQKINDKLSKIDKKIMRGDVDAPVSISSYGPINDLVGDGHNFRKAASERPDGIKVSCKPENYIPNLHAEKYGTVVDHGDIVQDFYDAVSDAGLSVPEDFPCGYVVSQAKKILNSFLYDNSRCEERMQAASRNDGGRRVDRARNWGRRFVHPVECTNFDIINGRCPEDPENVCTQVDENKPVADASSVEHDFCKETLSRYKEVMGIENYEDERRDVNGHLPLDYEPPIMPLAPEISIREAPILKVEITKEMCSLKKYSFTIGD
jgi:hypothetical protein